MKNLKLLIGIFCVLTIGLQSCVKDKCTREVTYMKYTPITKTLEEMKTDIESEAPRELQKPGKIYFYNNYIFINEIKEGVHVIDNSDPENPQNISFLKIPGNIDIAVKNNVLIADSYIFMATIDISDPTNVQLIGREETWNNFYPFDSEGRYIVDYTIEEVTETVECNNGRDIWLEGGIFDNSSPVLTNSNSGGQAVATGVGGSMARFTIYGNYLYAVNDWQLNVFDISDSKNPSLETTVDIGWGIETIFPYGDKLFIGSQSGMFIFDNSDPLNPVQLSVFQHARACDPVFVKDNYAYVTLRSGSPCEGFTNQLDLIDITSLTDPQLIESFPMDNPHGLSIKGNNLFLCEGDFGLKTFDIETPETFDERLLSHLDNFSTYDAIAIPGNENVLLVIGDDGFFQFNFDDPTHLKQLSTIPVNRE